MPNTIDFILKSKPDHIPDHVLEQALIRVIDLVAVAFGGYRTNMAQIATDVALSNLAAANPVDTAPVLFSPSLASRPGAAFANAAMIDSCDAHDGHAGPMGHAGVALLPTLLAFTHGNSEISGREFLTSLVIGYEIALRAGIVRTAHGARPLGSGGWNAIGCAAIGARLLGLDEVKTAHALGIAEFNAPISPIERSIAHPTMVKDAAGPGAFAGTLAAILARSGFTGSPVECMDAARQEDVWSNLGETWVIESLNFKPYPVIKWTEPAVEAALELRHEPGFDVDQIDHIEIFTFKSASTLEIREPDTTETAQYSLTFPVAAAIVHGKLDGAALSGNGLLDPRVIALSKSARIVHFAAYDSNYPAEQPSHIKFQLKNGEVMTSEPHVMTGVQPPLTMDVALQKFRAFGAGVFDDDKKIPQIEAALLSIPDSAAHESLRSLYCET